MGELVERPDEPAREDPRTVGVAVWSPVDPLPVAVFGAAEDAFRLRTPASAVAIGSRRGSSDGSSGRSSKGGEREKKPTNLDLAVASGYMPYTWHYLWSCPAADQVRSSGRDRRLPGSEDAEQVICAVGGQHPVLPSPPTQLHSLHTEPRR